jgi:hypothetical protein
MADSWCRRYTNDSGKHVEGAAARESRIKDQGGMDRITDKHHMDGFKQGYRAGREDATSERLDALEARVAKVEKQSRRV